MGHRCIIFLLILAAPLSWGEDVYYCVEELSYKIEKDDSNSRFELQRYQEAKFTFKFEADSKKLVFKGETFGGDRLYAMECRTCLPRQSYFNAADNVYKFALEGDRFFIAGANTRMSAMQAGTCTKF